MQVRFDSTIKIAGIGMVPWSRVGLEQWLPNYAVISPHGWGKTAMDTGELPVLFELTGVEVAQLPKRNTQSLVRTKEFQRLVSERLSEYDLLTYRPIKVPAGLATWKFLMVDDRFTARFENKVRFRQQFADKLPFPRFELFEREVLQPIVDGYKQIASVGEHGVVLQDAQLSGGKGTFIVRNVVDYERALNALRQTSSQRQVVVSELVPNAKERSIQCCVTKERIITGPLQRQIVRHPLLANTALASGDMFCGAQVLAVDQESPQHQRAQALATIVGRSLQADGYRGIFGVDFLLNEQNELLVIEVNPRITGVTPLLTSLFSGTAGVPFYLLHTLELGEYDYQIADDSVSYNSDGGLLVLHSLYDHSVVTSALPPSGTYRVAGGVLEFVGHSVSGKALRPGECILQVYLQPGDVVKPGGRIATLIVKDKIIDQNTDILYNNTTELIQLIHEKIKVKKYG